VGRGEGSKGREESSTYGSCVAHDVALCFSPGNLHFVLLERDPVREDRGGEGFESHWEGAWWLEGEGGKTRAASFDDQEVSVWSTFSLFGSDF